MEGLITSERTCLTKKIQGKAYLEEKEFYALSALSVTSFKLSRMGWIAKVTNPFWLLNLSQVLSSTLCCTGYINLSLNQNTQSCICSCLSTKNSPELHENQGLPLRRNTSSSKNKSRSFRENIHCVIQRSAGFVCRPHAEILEISHSFSLRFDYESILRIGSD